MSRKLPPKNFILLAKIFIICTKTAKIFTQMLVPNHRFCMSLMVCIVCYIVYMTKLSCSCGRRITENVPARARMIVRLYRLQPARLTKCKRRLPKSNLVLGQRAMRLVLLFERDPYQPMENLGSCRLGQGLNCGFCGPDFADLTFSIRITSHTTKKQCFSESL
jgi:hypothetical protein